MTGHVPGKTLAAYARGELDDASSWTLEAHVDSCAVCVLRLADLAGPDVEAMVDAGRAGIGAHGPLAAPVRRRAWARTWRRWTSWSLVGPAVVTALALLAAFGLDREYPDRPSLVLLLAPVAPLTGLALAWSHHGDPGWETVAGTARAGLDLLLRRALVVLAAVVPPLAVVGWALGRAPALWLLPCLTFTSATLLLGSLIGVSRAAAVLGGGWVLAIATPAVVAGVSPVLIQPVSVPGWAVAGVLLPVLTLLRSGALRRLSSWR
ncbi:zf-HC2 domain-containing protein [Cryptosporangium japonicum]|uniref:Zf-HC2 domain-containing protein n=1 Tax=Cryptosporangium japonicum TaxID=80872 RepID=A0ABP3DU81_9ACTN